MKTSLSICTRRDSSLDSLSGDKAIIVIEEKQIGKCRGCLRCKILKQCISYNDDAQLCIPLITGADHLDFYLQSDGMIMRLMERVLYALNGEGKTFTLHIEDGKEAEYLRRVLVWAKYKELT